METETKTRALQIRNIDEELLWSAKQLAARNHITLSRLVENCIRKAVEESVRIERRQDEQLDALIVEAEHGR